jgi:D-proline reductase (dithiol) PrdB
MTVDSFKFLPRLIATFYRMMEIEQRLPIPWAPLVKPLHEMKVGLITSGGIYLRNDKPFDLDRERAVPTWGDPTYRIIPSNIQAGDIKVSHLHLNTDDIEQDFNILLPIHRMQELIAEGCVGASASEHFSFMGYQGFPPDTSPWENTYGPQVAQAFLNDGVHCVVLTPA